MGSTLAATPDGRLAGESTSLNTGASLGADREGITAHIISVTTIDATDSPNSVTLDLDMHASMVQGKNGLNAMYATLKTYLEIFSYPDIQYCLHENSYKTSPAALNDGKTNLDLAIEESMLGVYQMLFRLVTMQVLRHCESDFHERDERYTMIILDEAARVGVINGLDAGMATLRSKHTCLVCLFQSISQFRDIYPDQKAQTLLNLCELKIFLSGAGDRETTEYVSGMVGDYDATRMSYSRKGFFGGKSNGNYSQERRAVIEGKDMMELRERGEAICFVYGHYMRVKKLRYFEDLYIAVS
jgi:type IV secretory pathway TraG/TraD family ATPase VirD4